MNTRHSWDEIAESLNSESGDELVNAISNIICDKRLIKSPKKLGAVLGTIILNANEDSILVIVAILNTGFHEIANRRNATPQN